ncbi:hypothetical protein ACFLU4_07630 [Chloroflexota bacterium]
MVLERIDVVDENILLALREGPQSLSRLHSLAGLNYHTCRQRLDKLLRYSYLAKPHYGEYALSEKGRRFVEELTVPVTPDLKDPKLKKLINMLPTELHRAFFRLLLSGIIAKYHLLEVYDDGYPAFILGGETKSFKTALATVVCKLLGLKPEENIYPLFSAIAGEFGVRRFRAKEKKFTIAASPLFRQPFVCLNEFDKVIDRDTRRNVLFFLDGRWKFTIEGELVENRVCTMVTLNTKIGTEGIERFGIPAPYIRRSIVADTEHVRMELRDVDRVAKKIFEVKEFPRINIQRLNIVQTKLTDDVFGSLRDLLMDCTEEGFQRLIDTMPLVILILGRSALLGSDVREAMYQTLWDRLVCLESLGGTVSGWREKVAREWTKYKREDQPEFERQLREAEKKEKERKQILAQRTATIEQKRLELINLETAFILHRSELSFQIQGLIQELGRGEPLAEPLRWLREKVNSSRIPEQLGKYEESLNKSTLPKVYLRLKEKSDAEERAKQEKEASKAIAALIKETKQEAARVQKDKEHERRRQRNAKIIELRAFLKQLNYYLRRKELQEGEDPVLTLQQLQIVQPVEGSIFLKVSDKPVKGYWLRDRWSGKPKYSPPICDFVDYGAKFDSWSTKVSGGRIYKWSEVSVWISWRNIWPLL